MNAVIEYLMDPSLTDEQRTEAIKALSPEQRAGLVQHMTHALTRFAASLVENKDQIWETGEVPSLKEILK